MMKRIKYLLPSFLTISGLIGCQESREIKFEKDGISFTCPSGWRITDKENINEVGYYLSVEKGGLNSSGLLTLTWVNDSLDLNDWLNDSKNELQSSIVYNNSNLVFEKNVNNKFNQNTSLSSSFTASIVGVKHRGIIHTFYGKGKTISLMKQEAIEDIDKNEVGFEIIEKSFINP